MINFKFKNKIRNNINSINNINNNITINDTYNSVIPLKIYQTWHSKDLPPIMSSCINELKYLNPEFEHIIYDDDVVSLKDNKKVFSDGIGRISKNLI